MNYDRFGQAYITESELCDLLYQMPDLDLSRFNVSDPTTYNQSVKATYAEFPILKPYVPIDAREEIPDELFHWSQQQTWYMPEDYAKLDIAEHILSLCRTDAELQRVGEELILYQERDMFNLLRYLKYFVDTMRANSVIWGLGRGSSVASYVLYLLGVHRIDSMYYDLDVREFLK
jgi:DNA polymerase III alpha subunit